MAATITWKIEQMERYLSDGGVFAVHWRVDATETEDDNTYYASEYGSMGIRPDASSESFVAYNDLTEEIVIGWVKAEMGEEQVTSYESSLQDQINTQKNPTMASGMPWIS